MQTVTVEGLDSITSKTPRSEGVGSERDRLQRETWCSPVEEIQARQGKSNTDVHLGLQAECVKEQHLFSMLS